MKQGLTEKQYETLTWIKNHIGEKGWSPSNEEIAAGMGGTAQSAGEMVARIIERGHLTKSGPRTLAVVD